MRQLHPPQIRPQHRRLRPLPPHHRLLAQLWVHLGILTFSFFHGTVFAVEHSNWAAVEDRSEDHSGSRAGDVLYVLFAGSALDGLLHSVRLFLIRLETDLLKARVLYVW